MSEFDRCLAALRNISANVRGVRTLAMVAFVFAVGFVVAAALVGTFVMSYYVPMWPFS